MSFAVSATFATEQASLSRSPQKNKKIPINRYKDLIANSYK